MGDRVIAPSKYYSVAGLPLGLLSYAIFDAPVFNLYKLNRFTLVKT